MTEEEHLRECLSCQTLSLVDVTTTRTTGGKYMVLERWTCPVPSCEAENEVEDDRWPG